MKTHYKIEVVGRVQGVGFRYYTQIHAQQLGILGYVKNLPNGNVYIEAEAKADRMELFLQQIKKGPALSRVDEIRKHSSAPQNFINFSIR